MKPFVVVALLAAVSTARAQAPSALQRLHSDLPLRLLAQAEDEDEEEEAEVGGLATPTPEQKAAVGPPAPTTSPTADPRAQELVSGAPLYNPNVAVHIVERKQFSDQGKHELVLFPVVPQVNGKFTNHWGSGLSYVYHLHENFGFQLTSQFNWYNNESAFNQELIEKVREMAQAATSLLLPWGVLGGVEVAPIYGKFAWYENRLAHYSLIVTAGAGYGNTRHQLKPETVSDGVRIPATFGDTGNRALASVGGGFRVLLGDRFAIRLEIRDIVYTAKVDQVNGCDARDLQEMDAVTRRGLTPSQAPGLTERCVRNIEKFDAESADVPLAYALVREPSSDVLNLVSFYGGISFIF